MNETSMILHVTARENGKAPGFPVVISFKVATEEVHELKAQMNDKPLRIGKEPDLKKL
jgi:hypothetical protein